MQNGCDVPFQVNPPPRTSTRIRSWIPLNRTCPADCATNEPSSDAASIQSALNARLSCANGTSPYPNNWPDWGKNPGDKRAVTLVTTNYGAFDQNGKGLYPVAGFGAFYIAGFSGNDCGDEWPAPRAGPGKNSGTIWGYFIKYSRTWTAFRAGQCLPPNAFGQLRRRPDALTMVYRRS